MLSAPVVLKILTTRAPGAQPATCSPAEVSGPTESPERSGVSGFVQSRSTLPARPPADVMAETASFAAPQGTVSATASPQAAASATLAAAALPPLAATS